MVPIHTIGQRYVDINATSNRAEEREEPDDSPVTSGPDESASWFDTGGRKSVRILIRSIKRQGTPSDENGTRRSPSLGNQSRGLVCSGWLSRSIRRPLVHSFDLLWIARSAWVISVITVGA